MTYHNILCDINGQSRKSLPMKIKIIKKRFKKLKNYYENNYYYYYLILHIIMRMIVFIRFLPK